MVFVIKTYLFLHFKRLYKKIKNIFFYFKLIYFFLVFLDDFDVLISKTILKKQKKNIILIYF
jgi:hypothetical protein